MVVKKEIGRGCLGYRRCVSARALFRRPGSFPYLSVINVSSLLYDLYDEEDPGD